MLNSLFHRKEVSPPIVEKRQIHPKNVSAIGECRRNDYHLDTFEDLVLSGRKDRKIVFLDSILPKNPVVRMFFKKKDGQDHTPIVTGHMIAAHVRENPEAHDTIDITIRVTAAQAANLPFVEVYDA